MIYLQMIAKAKTTLLLQGLAVSQAPIKPNNSSQESNNSRGKKGQNHIVSRSNQSPKTYPDKPTRPFTYINGQTTLDPSIIIYAGCGRRGHVSRSCAFALHPDANKEYTTWVESSKEKTWKALEEDVLPNDRILGGDPLPRDMVKAASMYPQTPCHCCNHLATSIPRDVLDLRVRHNSHDTTLLMLIDTSSLHGSYINREALAKLKGVGIHAVASGLGGLWSGNGFPSRGT
jgi:hypothetical protein